MSGLTSKLSALIQQLRLDELSKMVKFYSVVIYLAVFAFVPQQISPIVTFGAFIGMSKSDGQVLDAARMFTSISLLSLLNQPLSTIFQSFPNIVSAIGCLDRIQKYLSAESRIDHRLLSSPCTAADAAISRPAVMKSISKRVKIPDDIELSSLTGFSRNVLGSSSVCNRLLQLFIRFLR